MVSGAGITVDDDKIAVAKDWETPKTVSNMMSFLGLAATTEGSCKTLRSWLSL